MIGIIDYGMGNLASVQNALNAIGCESHIISDPKGLKSADKAILPGVGAFGDAMSRLNENGMSDAIKQFTQIDRKPFLGICLGMQLLFDGSQEFGTWEGLGLVPGNVLPLAEYTTNLSIPNIGWSQIQRPKESILTRGLTDEALCYYFVHSFFCQSNKREQVTGTLEYGVTCDVIVEADNIFACQFHPEKSQSSGIRILKNFSEI